MSTSQGAESYAEGYGAGNLGAGQGAESYAEGYGKGNLGASQGTESYAEGYGAANLGAGQGAESYAEGYEQFESYEMSGTYELPEGYQVPGGAAGAAYPDGYESAEVAAGPGAAGPLASVPIRCYVNGEPVEVPEVWIADSLLFLLRERLGRTAAKDGCGEGECGACVVLLDGEPVLGCLTPALAAEGSAVTTPEAYPDDDRVAAALAAHCGAGCGYCLPGIGLSVRDLLARQPEPSEAAVRESLSGHLCRCLPPGHFVDAVREAAARG